MGYNAFGVTIRLRIPRRGFIRKPGVGVCAYPGMKARVLSLGSFHSGLLLLGSYSGLLLLLP